MPTLTAPTTDLHTAWLAARDDWGRGVHQDGSGLTADDDVDSAAGFAAWVARLRREADPAVPPAPGRVHADHWWIVEDGAVLGAIALRHDLNDYLRRLGGHVGYGVRPAARGRGLATWALGEVLGRARARGTARLLLTCATDNAASARVIERHGGVLEGVADGPAGPLRRYWITLAG